MSPNYCNYNRSRKVRGDGVVDIDCSVPEKEGRRKRGEKGKNRVVE